MLLIISVTIASTLGLLVGVGSAGASGGTPTVTDVSPGTATANPGTVVTVTGTNLTGATAVHFGSVPATGIDVTSATQLTAVAPVGVGTVTVTVTTTDGTSATTSADHFAYPTGELLGWGTDADGELANGSTTVASSPVRVGDLGPLAQVSARATTTLALTPTGHVYAWGTNGSGQLGNGTTTSSVTPVEVEGVGGTGVLSGVTSVAEGADTSYALTSSGHVYAWGNSYWYGELGNGSGTSTSTTPVEVTAVGGTGVLSNVVAIAAGDFNTLALTATGNVVDWGRDTGGELGTGTEPTTLSRIPVEVEGVGGTGVLSDIVAISAGGWASYALGATGHVYAWGTNASGQLGDGTTTNRWTPVEVEGVGGAGDLSSVVAMTAGDAAPLALTASGHVYGWGTNGDGQLGDGTTTDSSTPVEVKGVGGTGDLSSVAAVDGNATSSYALTSSGAIDAWGGGLHGQLGNATTATDSTTPVEVKDVGGTGTLSDILSLGTGGWDAYALTTYPTVTAVSPATGSNVGGTSVTITGTNLTGATAVHFGVTTAAGFTVDSSSEITATSPAGTGTVTVTVTTPEATSPTGSADHFTYTTRPIVTALSPAAGGAGTVVAVTGANLTGATAVHFGSVPATGIDVTSATQLTAVAPAGAGTVTVTVTTSVGTSTTSSTDHFVYPTGELWGWGTDADTALANGSTTNATSPVRTADLGPLAQVSSNYAGDLTTTLALTSTGHVYAWGTNGSGQLGNGTTSYSTTPVEVKGVGGSGDLSSIVSVAEGEGTSYALGSTGHVFAWGDSYWYGELGNGSGTSSSTPVEVEGVGGSADLSDVVAIAGGDYSALALTATGHVYAWGRGTDGQLGTGTLATTLSRTPVEVEGVGGSGDLSGVVAIAAGGWASYALEATGHVYAWGTNANGQLGDGTTTNRSTPVEVKGVAGTGDLSGIVGISAGNGTPSAVSAAGHVYAWGANDDGQLGDGSTATTSTTPVEVKGVGGSGVLAGAVAVTGSGIDNYALTGTGNVYAWGTDWAGELGDGTTTDGSTTPVEVKGPGDTGNLGAVLAIDAGGADAFALVSYATATAVEDAVGIGHGEAAAHNPTCPCADPVNPASGDFSETLTDASTGGQATAATLTRTYDSLRAGDDSIFGYGWTSSYSWSLTTTGTKKTATVTEADGSQVTGTETGTSGTYLLPAWADSTLVKHAGGTWTLVRQQQTTYAFNASGQLTSVTDLAGDTTTLTYTSGKLISVTGAGGKDVTLTYNSTGLVTTVTAPSGTVTYSYATGNLTTVDSPLGTTTYTYNSTHDLTQVTAPGDLVTKNTYDADSRVTSETAPGGATTTFAYTGDAFSSYGGTTTITDSTGHASVQRYVDGELTTLTGGSGTSTAVTADYAFNPTTFGQTSNGVSGATPTTATYNAAGEVTSSTNADGDTTEDAYTTAIDGVPAGLSYCTISPNEHKAGVTCPAYGSTRTGAATETFNSAGDELTATTARGNTTHYAYTTSTDGVPAGLRYCTVAPGEYAKGVRCPAYGSTATGAATTTFDSTGHEITSTTPGGATTTTCYLGDSCAPGTAVGPDGVAYKVTKPSGTTTTDTYDAAGHVVTQVVAYHSYSATTQYSYDAAGHQVCEVSPDDDADGTRCPGSTPTPTDPPAGITATYYNATGQVTKSVGPAGATTLTAYTPSGQIYCTIMPTAVAKSVTCPSFTGITTPTAGSDPYLGATVELYNALGEKTTQASPLGAVTTLTYDKEGRVTSQTVATGTSGAPSVTTTTSYDAAGHATATTTGSTTTDTSYDPTGTAYCTVTGDAEANGATCPSWNASWLTTPPAPSSVPAGVTLTVDDATGETVQQTTPDGGTTRTSFDATDEAYCSVSAVNVKKGTTCPATPPTSAPTGTVTGYTVTIYNATGQVTSATTPTGTTTTTTYDSAGLKATVQKGDATTTYCHYGDSCAATAPSTGGTATDLYSTTLPPSQKEATGEVTIETYTPTGQVTTTKTPAAKAVDAYNAAGERTGVAYSTVASGYANPGDVTTTYNSTGTVASVTTATGTTTDSYNSAGDLTTQSFTPATGSHLSASSVGYAYYPSGATKSITYPSYGSVSDPTATYTYNTDGAMASVTDWLSHTTAFTDDHSGDVTSTAYPNSTTDAETYTTTGQVNRIKLAPNAHPTTPLATIGYTRNVTGGVTKETDAGDLSASPAYAYDKSARLSTSGTHSVAYDTRTDPTTLPTGATPTYDTAGELTSSTKGSTTTTYTYDTLGARTKVEPTAGPTTTYGVNALGQMTSAKSTATTGPLSGTGVSFAVNGTGLRVGETTSSGTQTFVWDTTGSVPQVLSDGTTAFVYGPNGRVVEQVDLSTTAPTYLVADQLGSTRLLTDQAGTVTGTYSFDAYGNVASHTGTATTPIGYAGGWETTATGLLYLIARDYTPTTGSFTSVDPDVALTTQAYAYATDDPVNLVDPNGRDERLACQSGSVSIAVGTLESPAGTTVVGQTCLYWTGWRELAQGNIIKFTHWGGTATVYTTGRIHVELMYTASYTNAEVFLGTMLCNSRSIYAKNHTNVQCTYGRWYNDEYYSILWFNFNYEQPLSGGTHWDIIASAHYYI